MNGEPYEDGEENANNGGEEKELENHEESQTTKQ